MPEMKRMTVEEFRAADKIPVVMVLDNLRSQNNVGSIFRTADAFRLEKIYLCGITATPPHREIHKTALGATESVDWSYSAGTPEVIRELTSNGYAIVALEQTIGSIRLPDYMPASGQKLAIVLGNEVNGIDDQVLELSDVFIEIPQFGTKHSINVSVAAGIMLWDILGKMKVI